MAVIWYLFSDENHNSDGRHVSYLKDPDLARLDPDLHAALGKIVKNNRRNVRAIAASGILPADTTFFSTTIHDRKNEIRLLRAARARKRAIWLKKALASAKDHQLVFLDPDNGLETASVQHHSPKSGKYVFWNEVTEFWEAGHSLIIYHHLNRTATVARQAELLKAKFRERFPDAPILRHFLARRGSCRHFWIIGRDEHAQALAGSIERISQTALRACLEVG